MDVHRRMKRATEEIPGEFIVVFERGRLDTKALEYLIDKTVKTHGCTRLEAEGMIRNKLESASSDTSK